MTRPTFEAQDLLEWCYRLEDAITEVVIVGRNPAMTDSINEISSSTLENLPTCGYAQLLFREAAWRSLSKDSAELVSFLKPKMFIS